MVHKSKRGPLHVGLALVLELASGTRAHAHVHTQACGGGVMALVVDTAFVSATHRATASPAHPSSLIPHQCGHAGASACKQTQASTLPHCLPATQPSSNARRRDLRTLSCGGAPVQGSSVSPGGGSVRAALVATARTGLWGAAV